MYERFYGLKERPFSLAADPRYLFMTEAHAEALCALQLALGHVTGITLLIGDSGTGKSTLVKSALSLQSNSNVQGVCLSNPVLTRAEFWESIASGLGVDAPAGASKARLLRELAVAAQRRERDGGVTILIVDEAQCLPDDLVQEIRLLSNLETSPNRLLPVLLVGQPELGARLNQPSFASLKQRVALRCRLRALDFIETAGYVNSRIREAGGEAGTVFEKEAVEVIYEVSQGIARTINVVCENALISGFGANQRPVSAKTVREVGLDLELTLKTKDGMDDAATSGLVRTSLPVDRVPTEDEVWGVRRPRP